MRSQRIMTLSIRITLLSRRARLAAVAIAVAATMSVAQQARSSGTERYLVRSWHSEDGLPSNIVRAVAQADDGYLWLATAEGVVRFDGVRFSRFEEESDAMFAQRPPRTLFALDGRGVWIPTTRGGLLHWDGQRFRAVWGDSDTTAPASRIVTQVASDGGAGVYIERGGEVFHAVGLAVPTRLERTPELEEKLSAAVAAQGKRASVSPPGAKLELLDSQGRLWTRTAEGGLAVSDIAERYEAIALPEFAPGSRITSLPEDREGNLWLGTNGNGLFQIRTRRVSVVDTAAGLSDRTILALMEDRSGALWAADKGGGIDRIVQGNVTHFAIAGGDANRPVSAICEDREGTLWVARKSSALFKWQDGRFVSASGPSLPVWRVGAIVEDANGRMWFGGEQGLADSFEGVVTLYGPEHGIPNREICALAVDGGGDLWAGTADGVLFHGNAGHFAKAGELGGRPVSAVLPDADGTVWITTLGAGLSRWKDGRLDRFSEGQGLPDSRLTCVLSEDSNYLWIGSLAGIFRVARSQLADVAAQRRVTADWLQFARADGMLSSECTGGFQPAGWRGNDGRLLFPTMNGIAVVQPATVPLNKLSPPVIIEGARAGGHAPERRSAVLHAGPGRSRLEFRYTALSFSAPEKVRFRTQLEGFEDGWRDLGTQRTAAYEAVPPGRYRFRVMAANSDAVWNETGAALAIVVTSNFWETRWFKGVAAAPIAVLVFAIGVAVSRARLRGRMLRLEAQTLREKERERKRARIAQDLHDDLGASLGEISSLLNLASDEVSRGHGRDPLPEIAAKAKGLVSVLDEIVWAANPQHDTLTSLADYLATSATELLDAARITLRLDIPDGLPPVPLEAEQRHGLFLAVREALHNAVKHPATTEVMLRLSLDARELKITVEDNGRGLSADSNEMSEGVQSMHARMERLGGSCRIDGGADGTNVCFSLPLARNFAETSPRSDRQAQPLGR